MWPKMWEYVCLDPLPMKQWYSLTLIKMPVWPEFAKAQAAVLDFFSLPFSHSSPCPPHSGQRNDLLLFSLSNPLYLWLVYCSILTFRTKEKAVRRELIMFLGVPTYLVLLNIKCCFCPSLFHVYCINMSTSFDI